MLFEKVQEIIADQFCVAKDEIKPDTDLVLDLGANSLDLVDLLTLFENEFKITIPEEEIQKFIKVKDIVTYLENLKDKK